MSGVMRVRTLVPIDVRLVRDARRNLSRDLPSTVEVSCGRIVTIDLSRDAVVWPRVRIDLTETLDLDVFGI